MPGCGGRGKELQILGIGGEEHQRSEAGRADGVALGDGLGGVADRVESVGGGADLARQVGHLGDTAGVVRDRAEGVERDHDAGERQHGGDGDGDAEEAGELECGDDAPDDHQGWKGGGFQRDREALDDVGAVAGDRGLGDRTHRAIVGAGVVLGDHHDQGGDDQADDAAEKEVPRGEDRAGRGGHLGGHRSGEDERRQRVEADQREDAGGDEALVERPHDRAAGRELHGEGADDRGDHAHAADRQRVEHDGRDQILAGEVDRAENHGGYDRDRVGLEEVGRHAGAVADVVADVVGDGGGVARVVLGNAGLDLADEVAADVGALGEDAAAEAGEDRDQRAAEAERDERVDHRAVGGGVTGDAGEDAIVDRDAEERETCHQHPGDGAGAEGERQPLCEAHRGGLGGADVGADRDQHADVARRAGEDGADQEADGDGDAEEPGDDDEDDDAGGGDGGVLPPEVGAGPFLDRCGDLLHARVAGVRLHDRARGPDTIDNGQGTTEDHKYQDHAHVSLGFILPGTLAQRDLRRKRNGRALSEGARKLGGDLEGPA